MVFGASCSPYLLKATLQHHLDKYKQSHPDVVSKLTMSMYVDDILSGERDEEQAYNLYLKSKDILKEGGSNLHKFMTNVPSLQLRIDEPEKQLLEAKHSEHCGAIL